MKIFLWAHHLKEVDFSPLKFIYKNNPKSTKKYEYQLQNDNKDDNKYTKLIKNLEDNGIGVKKLLETSRINWFELTQFIHPNLNIVEEIIS